MQSLNISLMLDMEAVNKELALAIRLRQAGKLSAEQFKALIPAMLKSHLYADKKEGQI